MDCNQFNIEIRRLKSLRGEIARQLESSTKSGLGKAALSTLFNDASSRSEALLEEYGYDIIEQSLNAPDDESSKLMRFIFGQYLQEQKQTELELGAEPESLITPDTTIDEVRNDLVRYLKADKNLDSNLVVYALKEKLNMLGDNPKSLDLKELEELCKDSLPDQPLFRLVYLYKIVERVKNLEVLETESYIFMLPKDKWEGGKIRLPNPDNKPDVPEFIAPIGLTAILKKEVDYDELYEADGDLDAIHVVYAKNWLGKEVRHFPWSKELILEANEKLLKPNGFTIPASWWPIVNELLEDLARTYSASEKQAAIALQDRFGLELSGFVSENELRYAGERGYSWSSSKYSWQNAYYLYFNSDHVSTSSVVDRSVALPVHCVTI